MVFNSRFFLMGIVLVSLGSCNGENGSTPSPSFNSPIPSPMVVVPFPSQSVPANLSQTPLNPKLSEKKQGLIIPTNPNNRLQEIKRKGVRVGVNVDPFWTIIPEKITPPPPVKPLPLPPPIVQSPLPPPFSPDLAQAVLVSGVLRVGSVANAIIKAPDESAVRYVREGDRLANGQVLVKRIEIVGISEPFVVLEQSGVEVIKMIEKSTDKVAS